MCRSHCECDAAFEKCLVEAKAHPKVSKLVKRLYFDVYNPKCINDETQDPETWKKKLDTMYNSKTDAFDPTWMIKTA